MSRGKGSVSTDTETPFIFADVTDYLLDSGEFGDVRVAVRPAAVNHRDVGVESAVVSDSLTSQRLSRLTDD